MYFMNPGRRTRVPGTGHRPQGLRPDPTAPFGSGCGRLLHELVTDQAASSLDAVALAEGDALWTYGSMQATIRRLARALAREGIGPDDVVAILATRTTGLVIAILGVLEVGARFLLLDADQMPGLYERALGTVKPHGLIISDPARETSLFQSEWAMDMTVRFSLSDGTEVRIADAPTHHGRAPRAHLSRVTSCGPTSHSHPAPPGTRRSSLAITTRLSTSWNGMRSVSICRLISESPCSLPCRMILSSETCLHL